MKTKTCFDRYDALELYSTVFYDDPNTDERLAERLTDSDLWARYRKEYGSTLSDVRYSVYGRVCIEQDHCGAPLGGIECIADFGNPEDARAVAHALAVSFSYDTDGPATHKGGVLDRLFIPTAIPKAPTPKPPRTPADVLASLITIVESKRIPIREDEGDPTGLTENPEPNEFFGPFEEYFDDSDAQHLSTGGGAFVLGGNVRAPWPALAELIDEAKQSIKHHKPE